MLRDDRLDALLHTPVYEAANASLYIYWNGMKSHSEESTWMLWIWMRRDSFFRVSAKDGIYWAWMRACTFTMNCCVEISCLVCSIRDAFSKLRTHMQTLQQTMHQDPLGRFLSYSRSESKQCEQPAQGGNTIFIYTNWKRGKKTEMPWRSPLNSSLLFMRIFLFVVIFLFGRCCWPVLAFPKWLMVPASHSHTNTPAPRPS